MLSLKAMQDQLLRVSVERDNAVDECRRLRLMTKNMPGERSGRRGTSKEPIVSGCDDNAPPPSDAVCAASKKKAGVVSSTIVTRRRALMEANGVDEDRDSAETGAALQL